MAAGPCSEPPVSSRRRWLGVPLPQPPAALQRRPARGLALPQPPQPLPTPSRRPGRGGVGLRQLVRRAAAAAVWRQGEQLDVAWPPTQPHHHRRTQPCSPSPPNTLLQLIPLRPLPPPHLWQATYFGAEIPFDLGTLAAIEFALMAGVESFRGNAEPEKRIYPGGRRWGAGRGFTRGGNDTMCCCRTWVALHGCRLAAAACPLPWQRRVIWSELRTAAGGAFDPMGMSKGNLEELKVCVCVWGGRVGGGCVGCGVVCVLGGCEGEGECCIVALALDFFPHPSVRCPQVKEIKNGRLAMLACLGFVAAHAAGQGTPLQALAAHMANPTAVNFATNGVSLPW